MQKKGAAVLALMFAAIVIVPYLATRAQSPQSEKCQGNDCLRILEKRVGHRCGSPDSLDVSIQNVSSENLRGYVVFETPNGKKGYSPTGLMRPGEKQGLDGPQYTCHSTGTVFVLANIGADPTYPPKLASAPNSGESQLAPSEFGPNNSAHNPRDLPNDNLVSPVVSSWKNRVGRPTNSSDGVFTLPVPEYDYYTSDATWCPQVMVNGKMTQRFALYREAGSLQITVKGHIVVRESDNVKSQFAGCMFPEQVQGNPKYHFHERAAVIGNRG